MYRFKCIISIRDLGQIHNYNMFFPNVLLNIPVFVFVVICKAIESNFEENIGENNMT